MLSSFLISTALLLVLLVGGGWAFVSLLVRERWLLLAASLLFGALGIVWEVCTPIIDQRSCFKPYGAAGYVFVFLKWFLAATLFCRLVFGRTQGPMAQAAGSDGTAISTQTADLVDRCVEQALDDFRAGRDGSARCPSCDAQLSVVRDAAQGKPASTRVHVACECHACDGSYEVIHRPG